MRTLADDLRATLRGLASAPWTNAVACVVLALGIGAFAAFLPIARAILWHGIDSRIVVLGRSLAGSPTLVATLDDLDLWRRGRGFDEMAGFVVSSFSVIVGDESRWTEGAIVSPSYFRAIGVEPFLGRLPVESDTGAMVVSSHLFWRKVLGGRRDAIGSRLRIDGVGRTVVAVMPPRVEFGATLQELWIPDEALLRVAAASVPPLFAVAWLGEGVSVEEAREELTRLERREAQVGERLPPDVALVSEQLTRFFRAGVAGTAATTLLVLIAGFASTANLLLARTLEREDEWILRGALGASPGRLARMVVLEALALGAAATVLGLAVAVSVHRAWALQTAAGDRWRDPFLQLDAPLVVVVVAAALAASALCAVLPARVIVRRAGRPLACPPESQVTAGLARRRRLIVLGAMQVAFVASMAASAAYQAARWWKLDRAEPAITVEGVSVAALWRSPMDRTAMRDAPLPFREVLRRALLGQAGIEAIATSIAAVVVAVGDPSPQGSCRSLPAAHRAVSPGYLELLGLEPLAGRSLSDADVASISPVAVVSRPLAEACWPPGRALGRRIAIEGDASGEREIVGVIEATLPPEIPTAVSAEVYVPERPHAPGWVVAFVKSSLGGPEVGELIRTTVRSLDPGQSIAWVAPLSTLWRDAFASQRFAATNSTGFALLAALIAALGTQAFARIVAHDRRLEIATRLAVGGPPGRVLRVVVAEFAIGIAWGVAAGFVVAWPGLLFIDGVVPGPAAPKLPAVATGLLVAAASMGLPAWLQLRRAVTAQPMAVLREM